MNIKEKQLAHPKYQTPESILDGFINKQLTKQTIQNQIQYYKNKENQERCKLWKEGFKLVSLWCKQFKFKNNPEK